MEEKMLINGREVGDIAWREARGREVPEIRYGESWLRSGFQIDPDLPLVEGWQNCGKIFGFLRDISPDRWGRRIAREIDPDIRKESEFIRGVSPELRMGAIDFASDAGRARMDWGPVSLNAFLDMLRKWEDGDRLAGREMRMIARAAASSGGSRPKLNIRGEGGLYLAKFPSSRDDIDVPLWEKVSLDMAAACGLPVLMSRLVDIPGGGHALLSRRFDRAPNGGKIHFMSAMTMCRGKDGEDASYLDIAQAIENSGNPADLPELWKRMLFNILTANRDDHLRNHGFLRIGGQWRLSPVYDLESDDAKIGHCLALDDQGHFSGDADMAIGMAPYYNLDTDDAAEIARDFSGVIARWEDFADRCGAGAADRSIMRACFQAGGGKGRKAPISRLFCI